LNRNDEIRDLIWESPTMLTETQSHQRPSKYAEILVAELEGFFRELIENRGNAPRVFTGINQDDIQFIVILGEIEWTRVEHVQRRAFISWLCEQEKVAAYALTGLMVLEDESFELEITAEDGEHVVLATLPIVAATDGRVSCGETKIIRQKPGECWHPYVGLMSPSSVSKIELAPGDEAFFSDVWQQMRPTAGWRERTAE
jgi:hypothetical protein